MLQGKGNPYGSYNLNQFTLMGLLPYIHNFIFKKNKILPEE
jgi:hypothetical protein